MDEDEGPHEDLNEHEMSEEASDSDKDQQEFDESSDKVSADDNNSKGLGRGVPYKKGRDVCRLAWRCKFRILVSLTVFWAKRNRM